MKRDEKKLLREAKKVVLVQRNHSVTYLQRKLGIGYNRAAELMSAIHMRKRRDI
jgi:DNA segregation ATPase FtsK/SpoIIIE-like protein